jgi:hypothetical protein
MKPLRRVVLHLLLALVIGLKAGLPEALPAHAQAATATRIGQSTAARPAADVAQPKLAQAAGDIDPCDIVPIPYGVICDQLYPAPELLYLSQGGMYAATAAQTASLRRLETQAVQDVLALHSLPPEDDGAARTWGRDDVLSELYILLVEAANTTAAERTTDQQNAVDWLTTVAKRRNIAAATNAAREYVKWAGLGRSSFDALMATNPTKAQIETFLSGAVLNFDALPPNATEGWCIYRSPTPYGDDYKGYNSPICSTQVIGIFLPPTPTYEDFVKWGAAKSTYSLLSSGSYLSRAQTLGISLGLMIPLAAAIAGYFPYTLAVAAVASEAALAALDVTTTTATVLSVATTFSVVAGVTLVTTIILAVVAAVILGINVTDAANLPGKLAKLLDDTNNSTVDAATLISSTDSTTSLFSIFVAVTAPAPRVASCDNSLFLPPGLYELTVIGTDTTTITDSTTCLNPTIIPKATATDPKFIVKNAAGVETLSPTISVKDTSTGTVSTARLSGDWFITQTNGTAAQTLRLAYTDWDGDEQNAWLVGNPTDGYVFLTYSPPADATKTVDPETCADDGTCGSDTAIKYIGADGQHY